MVSKCQQFSCYLSSSADVLSFIHFNYLNKTVDGVLSDNYLKIVFKKIMFIKKGVLCFQRKMKSEMKLNSEHLLELATRKLNAIWRMQYFF